MLKESDIVYELGPYWAMRAKKVGYDIFKTGITHSTRCAHIGFEGEAGLQKVKVEIARRIEQDKLRTQAGIAPVKL